MTEVRGAVPCLLGHIRECTILGTDSLACHTPAHRWAGAERVLCVRAVCSRTHDSTTLGPFFLLLGRSSDRGVNCFHVFTVPMYAAAAAAAAAKSLQSCPTLRPHRRQPTRLPRPWDSPGKNTGVGSHFLLQCMEVKSESEVAQSCPTLSDPMDCTYRAPLSMGFNWL